MKMADNLNGSIKRSAPDTGKLAARIKDGPNAAKRERRPASVLFDAILNTNAPELGRGSDEPQHPIRMPDVRKAEATKGAPGTEPTDVRIPMRPRGEGVPGAVELANKIKPTEEVMTKLSLDGSANREPEIEPPMTALEAATAKDTDPVTGKEVTPLKKSMDRVTEIDALVERTGIKNPQKEADVRSQITQKINQAEAADLNQSLKDIQEEEEAGEIEGEGEMVQDENGNWVKTALQDGVDWLGGAADTVSDTLSPLSGIAHGAADFLNENSWAIPAMMGAVSGGIDPSTGLATSRAMIDAEAEQAALDRKAESKSDGTSNLRFERVVNPETGMTEIKAFDRKTGMPVNTQNIGISGKSSPLRGVSRSDYTSIVKPVMDKYDKINTAYDQSFSDTMTGMKQINSPNVRTQKMAVKTVLRAIEKGRLTDFDVDFIAKAHSLFDGFEEDIKRLRPDEGLPPQLRDAIKDAIENLRIGTVENRKRSRKNVRSKIRSRSRTSATDEELDKWLGEHSPMYGEDETEYKGAQKDRYVPPKRGKGQSRKNPIIYGKNTETKKGQYYKIGNQVVKYLGGEKTNPDSWE